jgi:uncharacterized membrane protein
MAKTASGVPENIAGLLCYLLGWISGLIFFLIETENRFVRFHAMQSIIVFGAINIIWLIIWVPFQFTPFLYSFLGTILGITAFILWIILMIKAYQGTMYKLPVVGDLAEKLSSKKA